jgi:hypothetical protein
MGIVRQHKGKVGVSALALFFTALTFFVTRPAEDPFQGAAVTNPPFKSLTYGIQAFLWWDGGQVGVHLDWVRLMMFTHVKQIFAWQDIEPEPDEWHFERADAILDEIERRNLKLVVRLGDLPDWAHPSITHDTADFIDAPPDADHVDDWAKFCGTVAHRYKGRISAYQIWNEPNLRREWGDQPPDAQGYIELLRVCSEAIRAADPDAILISAGLAPTGQYDDNAHRDDIYLHDMYQAGFQQYIDVVGIHAPGFAAPDYGPDDAEREGRGRWATFRRVEDLRKIMINNGDAARQVAILEVGWTTDPREDEGYEWFAVDEETQARNLVGAFEYARDHWRPWVGLMSVIYIAKPDWTPDDEQYWWAITTPDNFTRPAFGALTGMAKYCGAVIVPYRRPEESAVAPDFNPCS